VPTAEFQAGLFFSNLKTMIRQDEGGDSYTLAWPLPPNTGIDFFDAANDTGKFVAGILANPEAYIGKEVLGTTAKYTPNDICRSSRQSLGRNVKYVTHSLTTNSRKRCRYLPLSSRSSWKT
jgi:hypothetical protein